jgi:predicted SnoaL-like aldol condensation-catalyzing enzyme
MSAHTSISSIGSTDDPQDRGIAGVDIFKMDADGKAIEHWDVSQEIGDPKHVANPNGVF